jgi:hypothetical protein
MDRIRMKRRELELKYKGKTPMVHPQKRWLIQVVEYTEKRGKCWK